MKKFEFSKIILSVTLIFSIIGIILTLVFSIKAFIDSTIAIAIISACATIIVTSQVWYYKKSSAENTVKIYVNAIKEIINLKQERKEDITPLIEGTENHLFDKMTSNIDLHLDDSTSLTERQDVPVG